MSFPSTTASESAIQGGTVAPAVETKPKRLTRPLLFATLTACLGAVSFGFVLGYPSPVQKDLKEKLDWEEDNEVEWFTSISALGAMLGALIGLYTIDKYGRKLNIMMCSLPLIIGWVVIAGANVTSLIYIGRFLTGAAVGVASLTVPLYIAEISPAKYRGALGSANQLGMTVGFLIAYGFGAFLKRRWLAIVGTIPSAVMAVLMTVFPETPRWLIKNGRIHEACQVLVSLRQTSVEECEAECSEIQSALAETESSMSLSEFKNPVIYRPFIISITLMVLQQFSGVNAVTSYASVMLENARIGGDANTNVIAIGVVQFLATAVSCLIVDKLGRRVLLIFSTALMSVSMAVLGVSRYENNFPSSITLTALCLYIVGYSLGLGPIPWLAMSELFPIRVRGVASGIATQVNWLCAFTVTRTYHDMENTIKPYGTYWFYAGICIVCAIYVAIFLPETKGKTLEEVEELFARPRGIVDTNSAENYYTPSIHN